MDRILEPVGIQEFLTQENLTQAAELESAKRRKHTIKHNNQRSPTPTGDHKAARIQRRSKAKQNQITKRSAK